MNKIKLSPTQRLNKLKKHLNQLRQEKEIKEEIKELRNKLKLDNSINNYVVVSSKIRKEIYLDFISLCDKNKFTPSGYIRELIIKEIEKEVKK